MVKRKILNQKGDGTLIGLLTAIGLGAVVSLGAASVFTFGINQFNVIAEQNRTEENLLLAGYYMRAWLSQATKIVCSRDAAGNPDHVNNAEMAFNLPPRFAGQVPNSVPPDYSPIGLGEGHLDCRGESFDGNFHPGLIRPFALFFREAGGIPEGAALNSAPVPDPRPSGIFFCPGGVAPDGVTTCATSIGAPQNQGIERNSGVLFFATGTPGARLDARDGFMIDHIVDVAVIYDAQNSDPAVPLAGNTNPLYQFRPLRFVSVRIIARYFRNVDETRDYQKVSAINGNAKQFRDIEITVPINFRNNWIRPSGGVSQRLFGEAYFYGFSGPNLADMKF